MTTRDDEQQAEREPEAEGEKRLGSVVASFDLEVTLRSLAGEVAAPSATRVQEITTEALGNYRAAFGVDTITVRARRTDG